MKEYLVYYHIFDQKDEPRTLTIKANTLKDATIMFNVDHGKSCTLLYVEEKYLCE